MTRTLTSRARSLLEVDACGIGFVASSSGESSREMVDLALTGLACVKHRGAIAADGLSGDGAGILTPIPRRFFGELVSDLSEEELDSDRLGVVTAFFDREDDRAVKIAQEAVAEACSLEGIRLISWRLVPTDESHLGAAAQRDLPSIFQAFVESKIERGREAERSAFRARKRAEKICRDEAVRHYFASWSFETVVYKALVISDRLADFYPDLASDAFEVPLAIFHSRFSTNTSPAWERAQPFRTLCHNGEINTVQGNENRMRARGILGTEEVGLGPEDLFRPVLDPDDSDSGKLDSAVELLSRGGRDMRQAVAMLIPEAWEGHRDLPSGVRDFFRYSACITGPWDGPAGIVFTDGRLVGAALDRNGLRPLRWQVCEDGLVVCASEVGAVPVSGRGKVERGRLGPGQMLCVDPSPGPGIQHDLDVKTWLAERAPYAAWIRDGLYPISPGDPVEFTRGDLLPHQIAAGLTKEEVAMVIKPMATDAKEPTFSMGDDVPLAAMASRPRPIYNFLKQRFAQVSNPPIDHLRERLVMSLRTLLGPLHPLLTEHPDAARLLELPSFFLYPSGVEALFDKARTPFTARRLDATFSRTDGAPGLESALDRIATEAEEAAIDGTVILVVSDVACDAERVPVPSLLAVGAVHHRLIETRLRQKVSIVADSADARDVHAIACLLGYGADAICPRVGLSTVAELADDGQLGELHSSEAQANYQAALEDGALKIFSKMGISTVDGYRSAQIFEAVGLSDEVVDRCLRGTDSAVGGLDFDALGADAISRHEAAYPPPESNHEPTLDEPGFIRYRKRGGEYHANNPEVIDELHRVSLSGSGEGTDGDETLPGLDQLEPAPPEDRGKVIDIADPIPDPVDVRTAHLLQTAVGENRAEYYERFRNLVQSRPVTELHDLLELTPAGPPIPLEEVEPAEAITRRFSTGAMSHGSLSAEAHETLAIAMNMIGGKSNCGEGGEDPSRFKTRGTTRDKNSRIKQIASGRFGVTPEYCAYADELNIKIAQGSKPGEGGQLPGHKVSTEIAKLRYTQPGVGLISPPPHHDIYSIEDLAQLIYDLKQVNPAADVSVKLVAETGVGTIAAGVVKALADAVQISGANGGTGASPLSSIKNAGLPWEIGLADAQKTLIDNHLRDRVRLRVDGGFKTGREVLIAALLGADEFSFGTAALMAEGCIMVRACHRDTCPTGIATQRPNLRERFKGTPEGVARYLLFVAEEVRGLLASLGLRSLDEAVGRVELLRQKKTGNPRIDSLDLTPLITPPADESPRRFVRTLEVQRPRSELDERLLNDAYPAIWEGREIDLEYQITNSDRTVGASLGGAIGLEWGSADPPGMVTARFEGSAGQSFGAFLSAGIALHLVGEANDYLGKGMGGGRIVVTSPDGDARSQVLAGNTILYGATGGHVYIAGEVGERFCVRNSGAIAIAEGCGDHGCEYMTGGTVVIIGPVGYNFGAGMTGGEAYVYDVEGHLTTRLNRQLVEAGSVDAVKAGELRYLLERHVEFTESRRAEQILVDWETCLDHFLRISPLGEVARIERANEGVIGAPR